MAHHTISSVLSFCIHMHVCVLCMPKNAFMKNLRNPGIILLMSLNCSLFCSKYTFFHSHANPLHVLLLLYACMVWNVRIIFVNNNFIGTNSSSRWIRYSAEIIQHVCGVNLPPVRNLLHIIIFPKFFSGFDETWLPHYPPPHVNIGRVFHIGSSSRWSCNIQG